MPVPEPDDACGNALSGGYATHPPEKGPVLKTKNKTLPHRQGKRTSMTTYLEMATPCLLLNLQWNEQVAESSAQTSCQYKKYNDGSVHGNQCIVKFRASFPTPSASTTIHLPKMGFSQARLSSGNPS